MGFIEVLAVEKPGILAGEYFGPDPFSRRVIDRVAQDRG